MMPFSPEYFMRQAILQAEKGLENGEFPIGAVVVLNNEIIAAAHTAETAQQRLLVHAELLALEIADKLKPFPGKRRDMQLFTNLEPCLMCLGAAMSFSLGKIYFALEAPGDGAVEMAQTWQRREGDFPSYRLPEIYGGILRAESLALWRRYVEVHTVDDVARRWAQTLANLPDKPV
jgi:tRNA(adenine34) deaminase